MGAKDLKAKQSRDRSASAPKRVAPTGKADRSRSRSQSKPAKTARPKAATPAKAPKVRPAQTAAASIDLSELLGAGSAAKPAKPVPARVESKKPVPVAPAPAVQPKKAAEKPVPAKSPAPKRPVREAISLEEMIAVVAPELPVAQPKKAAPARHAGHPAQFHDRIPHFMNQLKARDRANLKQNAELLSSIIQTFGENVDIDAAEIIQITLASKGARAGSKTH